MTFNHERPSAIPWPPIIVVSCLSAGYGLHTLLPLLTLATSPIWMKIAGTALIAIGILIDLYCAYYLRQFKTTVLPHRAANSLVTSGPFGLSRNPIYLGYLLILFGAALFIASLWMLIFTGIYCLLITYFSIKPEEAHLQTKFGDTFEKYRQTTPRWLGPF